MRPGSLFICVSRAFYQLRSYANPMIKDFVARGEPTVLSNGLVYVPGGEAPKTVLQACQQNRWYDCRAVQ